MLRRRGPSLIYSGTRLQLGLSLIKWLQKGAKIAKSSRVRLYTWILEVGGFAKKKFFCRGKVLGCRRLGHCLGDEGRRRRTSKRSLHLFPQRNIPHSLISPPDLFRISASLANLIRPQRSRVSSPSGFSNLFPTISLNSPDFEREERDPDSQRI